jgi:cysteine-rich repeat protein
MRRTVALTFGWFMAVSVGCGARTGLFTPEAISGSGGVVLGAAGEGGAANSGGAYASTGGTTLGGALGVGGGFVAGGASGFAGSGGGAFAGMGGNSGSESGNAGTAGMSGAAGDSSSPRCGDGRIQVPEQCDDGNLVNGDGCSAGCLVEPRAVNAGFFFACATGANGVVKCWGQNDGRGNLGLGDDIDRGGQANQMGQNLPALNFGTGRTVRSLATNSEGETSCVILDDWSVKCWGVNIAGELGVGDTVDRGDEPNQMGDYLPVVQLGTGRSARALSCGPNSCCAVLDDATLKCWGASPHGELGLGDTRFRGNTPGSMGDALPTVNLGAGRTVQAVSVGSAGACALLDHGTVKCWGDNTFGELGVGDTVPRGDEPNQMGDDLPAVDLGTGRFATAVSSGEYSACALLDDDSVKCWGANDAGQLGLGDTRSRGVVPSDMGDQLPPVNLGTGRKARAISIGVNTACAVLDNGSLKCWGYNATGQLGLGDSRFDLGGEPNQMGDSLPAVDLGAGRTARAVSPGEGFTCALLDNGTVKCWGANSYGELGLGDTVGRGDKPGEMGDALPAVDLVF